MGEHDGQSLVAGDGAGEDGGDQHCGVGGQDRTPRLDASPDGLQQPGPLENAGVGGGEADDGPHLEHGDNAAPVDHGGQLRALGGETQDGVLQKGQGGGALIGEAEHRGSGDAGQHGRLHPHPQGGEHQNQSRRDEGEGTQTELQGEEGGDVRRLTGGGGRQAEEQIQPGGEGEGDQAGPQHLPDVPKQVGPGEVGHQQGAGGDGGAPVSKVDPGQDGTTGHQRVGPQGGGHGHADGAHGGRRAESSASEEGDQAVEQKGAHQEQTGLHYPDGIAHNGRDGAPRPPERGEDADEDEGGQDIFSGPDPLSGHTQHLRERKALSDGVQGKNDISQQQGEQEGDMEDDAHQQRRCEQREDKELHDAPRVEE